MQAIFFSSFFPTPLLLPSFQPVVPGVVREKEVASIACIACGLGLGTMSAQPIYSGIAIKPSHWGPAGLKAIAQGTGFPLNQAFAAITGKWGAELVWLVDAPRGHGSTHSTVI